MGIDKKEDPQNSRWVRAECAKFSLTCLRHSVAGSCLPGPFCCAARRVVEGHKFVHSGQWNKWRIDLLVGQDVHHRTLGIFGMGRIGQAVARRGRGFEMRILYSDAVRAPEAVERELGAEFVTADRLLREADFISVHVPLLPRHAR